METFETDDFFHPVDTHFAAHFIAQKDTPSFFFLAYLLKISREGHLCLVLEKEVFPQTDPALERLLREGANQLPSSLFDTVIVQEGARFYLKRNWKYEKQFLEHYTRLKSQKPLNPISTSWLLEEMEKTDLLEEQKKVIRECAERTVSLILGGPGTGKTYTARLLVELFLQKISGSAALCAPTGKATSNFRSSFHTVDKRCQILTLHSLLKTPLLSEDLVLVDEASMIDAKLMARLFASIKKGARLILLGDPDQLPPVESGHFFADLAKEKNGISKLTKCLRTDLKEIVELAANVQSGKGIAFKQLPPPSKIIDFLEEKIKAGARILTPLKKGLYGVEFLNKNLLARSRERKETRVPIMISVNDAYLELYNGDTGHLDEEQGLAYFGARTFPRYLLPRFAYAFTLSVHKSQGSEFDHVLILLPEGSERFGRKMLYTAITRAKKSVEIYTQAQILEATLKNQVTRISGVS